MRHVTQHFAGHRVGDVTLPGRVGGLDMAGQIFE
jgi:hypothetical protein